MNYVFIQGNLLPAEEAMVPFTNRALRFGDGVFETIRIEDDRLYNYKFHLNRLNKGLKAIKLEADTKEIEEKIHQLIDKNMLERGFARVSISRCGASKGWLPLEPKKPFIYIETINGIEEQPAKINLHISSYKACTLAPAKTMNGLTYSLALLEAHEHECDNALLLDAEGNICETANGNIFWVKGGKLYTPSDKLPLIPGSIRERIIKLHGATEVVAKIDELKNAEEVFMTNVNCLVLPCTDEKKTTLKVRKLIEDDIRMG